MKKHTKHRPLTLAVETIRQLDTSQLALAAGGQEAPLPQSNGKRCGSMTC